MNAAISVITVCRNAKEHLLRTTESLQSQSCRDFEWIIIDGDSTDGTRKILEGMNDPWITWISEPDAGIYDAMNKGMRLAKGKWLWFLNAGDRFLNESTLQNLLGVPEDIDICYGETMLEDAGGTILGKRSEITPHKLPYDLEKSQFRYGMVVSHQAFIPRRDISPEYDATNYRFSSDLDWMLRILSKPRKTHRIGTLAIMPRDGATKENWYRSQWERFAIMSHHFGLLSTLSRHVFIIFRRLYYLARTGKFY